MTIMQAQGIYIRITLNTAFIFCILLLQMKGGTRDVASAAE